jgi:glutaredoxin 3
MREPSPSDAAFRLHNAIFSEAMKPVTMYTTDNCPFCSSAKMLLAKRKIDYTEINLARDPDGRNELVEKTGMITFPQIVIDGETIGGFQELLAVDRAGKLPELLGV